MGEEYRRTTMQTLRVAFVSGAVLDLAATLATALVAVTLGLRLVDGAVSLRAALTVLLLTPELYVPLRALALQFHASADGLAAAERILALLDAPGGAPAGAAQPPAAWRSLRLEHVVLAYPDRSGPVLDDLELELRRGELVALVGRSGAGKTTVASLLLGLRRPDAGSVTVDGCDLAGLDAAAWRRQVAWVPQRPTLFHGSVAHNIGLGADGATAEPSSTPPRASPAPTSSYASCRAATRPRSARAAAACRPARRAASPWPAPCCATRPCSSSTNPPPTSTPRAPPWSPRPSARRARAGRCS